MMSRRAVLAGLAGATIPALAGCAQRPPPALRDARTRDRAAPTDGLDAVIDISHLVDVSDFTLMRRRSNILAVVHKATEGGDWIDPAYGVRRSQAKAAGLLWGAYHFGTHQYAGEDQATNFLDAAQPGPDTVMALDLEPNELNRANTMTIAQAEAFVRTIYRETGRFPMVYTHPTWANGDVYGRSGLSLGRGISRNSILVECDLWLADYREEPELPLAWEERGWAMWQYTGNESAADSAYGAASRGVAGVNRCDRNLFAGDRSALYRFWSGRDAAA